MWDCLSPFCCHCCDTAASSDTAEKKPFVKSDTLHSLQTAEPAEEVKMETQDTVIVQTEQPVSAPSPVELGGSRPSDEQPSQAAEKPEGKPDSVEAKGSSNKNMEESTEGTSVDVDKASVALVAKDGVTDNSREEKVDRLDRLAQQIDDFDPAAILGKGDTRPKDEASGASSEFSMDINDERLIDELVDNVGGNVSDNKAKEGDTANGGNDREVTPEADADLDDLVTDSNDKLTDNPEENGCDDELIDSNGIDGEKEDESEQSPHEQSEETNTGQTTIKTDVKMNKHDNKNQKENASPTKSGKSKRKEDKSIDHILKALSSLQTTEEKLAALCKKYADLHEDHRVLQTSFKQGQRKITVISREKDQLQTEHTKAVMAKSKLESLCRELQKHNQVVRQESLQRAREEDEKRKEISQKFQTTIGEIQTQMQENHEKNTQLREENFELANKLKKFIEQYEAREKQIEKVIQHRELEGKLADAKLEQATAILMEEKGKNQKEKELLLMQTTEYVKKLQIKEAELSMYKERYEEFQTTIKKSEEMFQKFKSEMDKMTKRCKKLEKDGVQWKQKWENANRALLEMAEEKTKYDKEKPMLLSKITKLESLCRAMQAERKARKILESDGIDISKLTVEDDLPSDEQLKDQVPAVSDGATASGGTSPVEQVPVVESTTDGEPDIKSEAESCPSSASEQTDVTVLQQNSGGDTPPGDVDTPPGDVSQSDSNTNSQSTPATEQNNQSETSNEAS